MSNEFDFEEDEGRARSREQSPSTPAQSLEELQKRFNSLNQQKIRAETMLENAQNRLAELKEEARRDYGTDDVGELRRKLEEMKAENERKRADYQSHLDTIETELSNLETTLEEEGSDGSNGG